MAPHIYLKGLPAVFKLRVKKSETDRKIFKVTILLDKRIKPSCTLEKLG
jgi:hypothetical protein